MFPLWPRTGKMVLLCTLLTPAGLSLGKAQVLNFDVTAEGPWSDIDRTTLTVPMVPDGSVSMDGKASSSEYGGFEGVPVIPGENAWILNFPGDRDWTDANDSSFTFWLAHDQDHFYVAADVKDDVLNSDDPNPQLWKDDSIEIVIDALNDRYDNNTDNSNDPYGGHSYFSYEGKFSVWDEAAGARGDGRWSTAVDFTYGDGEDVWAVGQQGDGGWQLEVRFHKRLFEDPEAGNKLQDGYRMGFNIGVDDDDKTGPGPNGSGARSQDLELQYFWANRARLKGWNAEEADWYTEQELADKIYEDHFDRVIDAAGRLAHGGTGEIIFAAASGDNGGGNNGGGNDGGGNNGGGGPSNDDSPDLALDPTKTQMALPLPQAPV
ncbi:MAG: sugar-binding protein, partial [Limisphaerales bacterium]